MSNRRHLGFGSTPNFPNLYKEVARHTDNTGRLAYANYDPSLGVSPTDEQKELLQNYVTTMPILTFTGSEKLHGENMAVCFTEGELWVQGRNHIRTLLGDQNGMAMFVESTKADWLAIFEKLAIMHFVDLSTHTIVIDCEWAGGNIQKGNAACSGTDKGAYIFDYCRVVSNTDDSDQVLYPTANIGDRQVGIYNMASFGTFTVQLDFNKPAECEETLQQLALLVEANSPIAEYFDKDNVGEGAYLYCMASGDHPTYRLKTKGEKHGGKPKDKSKRQAVTDEQKAAYAALADTLTPVWRITQAITETGATERKHVGEVLKWVMVDIAKEEIPTLAEAGIEFKKVQGFVASIVKEYFFDYIKEY